MPTDPTTTAPLTAGSDRQRPGLERVWMRTALVAGLFFLLVCAAMVVQRSRAKAQDPLKSPQLVALKEKLLLNPKDEPLKQQIRELDLLLRQRYFRQVLLNWTGAWLAAASLLVCVTAAKQAQRLTQALPMPQLERRPTDQAMRAKAWSRWSVGAVGTLTLLAVLGLGLNVKTALPKSAEEVARLLNRESPGGSTASDFAALAELRQNWPRFRGADGSGVCLQTNLPTTWDAKTGSGILWKSAVPVPGFNSPIVWGDRIYLSGGDASKREVLCYDARKGELLWRQAVSTPAGTAAKAPEIPEQTGFAASTMATDGRRVYVIFANSDLAAFTLDGKPVWSKYLGPTRNPHGHATSLLTWEGQLIVQLDQGEAEQNASKLYALDGRNGQVLWQRARAVPSSWATPIVIEAAGAPQIIALGVPWIMAYSAKDGTERWRVDGLANEVTPSPIVANGLVLAISPNDKLMAIRPDGQGDVTKTHLAWSADENVPDISSPVSNGDLVFTLSTPGVLTCFDAKDGKKQWEQDLAMECQASPSLAANHLYVIGAKGAGLVVEAGRQYKELVRNDLAEKVYASPAFASGRIFVRGSTNLFCIGAGLETAKSN